MESQRGDATATLLPDGRVLVVGGRLYHQGYMGPTPLNSAELWDPTTGRFTATGSLAHVRWAHTATLLPNGKVLIAGGEAGSTGEDPLSSAELWDPSTGTFSPTGSMSHVRTQQTATLLPNGKVLIAGGEDAPSAVASAEIYDPATGTFSSTGSMSVARMAHTATLLGNGKVLVAGGAYFQPMDPGGTQVLATAEIYDPATGRFTPTGSMRGARYGATATRLGDGRVLVAGGGDRNWCAIGSAEIYDPAGRTFSAARPMMNSRISSVSAPLPDGRVLIAGGVAGIGDDKVGIASAEIFDPATGEFSPAGSMSSRRGDGMGTSLADGRVLLLGGYDGTSYLATAEIYTP